MRRVAAFLFGLDAQIAAEVQEVAALKAHKQSLMQ
jgi:hypothetical protein